MDCQSHLHQIGLGMLQYFDDWNGQFFLHHPFEADVISQIAAADSFAEIYWEDKIMPYVNPAYANEAIAKGGTQVADEKIFRCMSDVSLVQPFMTRRRARSTGSSNRTSYLMNSLLSHKTRRYGRWTFPRFQYEIGIVELRRLQRAERGRDPHLARERRARGRTTTTSGSAPIVLDTWIPWNRHGASNVPVPRRPRPIDEQGRRLQGHVPRRPGVQRPAVLSEVTGGRRGEVEEERGKRGKRRTARSRGSCLFPLLSAFCPLLLSSHPIGVKTVGEPSSPDSPLRSE